MQNHVFWNPQKNIPTPKKTNSKFSSPKKAIESPINFGHFQVVFHLPVGIFREAYGNINLRSPQGGQLATPCWPAPQPGEMPFPTLASQQLRIIICFQNLGLIGNDLANDDCDLNGLFNSGTQQNLVHLVWKHSITGPLSKIVMIISLCFQRTPQNAALEPVPEIQPSNSRRRRPCGSRAAGFEIGKNIATYRGTKKTIYELSQHHVNIWLVGGSWWEVHYF